MRRKADFLLISAIGTSIYFIPAIDGYVINPYQIYNDPNIPISDETYIVMIIAMLGYLISGFMTSAPFRYKADLIVTKRHTDISLVIIVSILLVGAIIDSGAELFSEDKLDVLAAQGRFLIFYDAFVQIAFFLFFIQRKYLFTLFATLNLAFIVYIGFRFSLANSAIAIIAYYLSVNGMKFLYKPLNLLYLSSFAIFILMYKSVYIFVKLGRFDIAKDRLFDFSAIRGIFYSSEPFVTQLVLNTTVTQNYKIPATELFINYVLAIPLASYLIPLPFEDYVFDIQSRIYPGLSFGLASNIYAQFYAAMGIFGVVFFVVQRDFALTAISKYSRAGNPIMRAFLYLSGSFIAFYINRNDIQYSLVVINRLLLSCVLLLIVSTIFESARYAVVKTAEKT